MECPICNVHNGETAAYCKSCGSPLALKPCARCETMVVAGAGPCPVCGLGGDEDPGVALWHPHANTSGAIRDVDGYFERLEHELDDLLQRLSDETGEKALAGKGGGRKPAKHHWRNWAIAALLAAGAAVYGTYQAISRPASSPGSPVSSIKHS